MRKVPDYLDGLGYGNIYLAQQGALNQLNYRWRKMSKVAQGLVFDLAVLTVGAAQQVGHICPALALCLDAGYMDSPASSPHAPDYTTDALPRQYHYP